VNDTPALTGADFALIVANAIDGEYTILHGIEYSVVAKETADGVTEAIISAIIWARDVAGVEVATLRIYVEKVA